jgi:hypothetical protein
MESNWRTQRPFFRQLPPRFIRDIINSSMLPYFGKLQRCSKYMDVLKVRITTSAPPKGYAPLIASLAQI